jgi:Leucine Rich repeat
MNRLQASKLISTLDTLVLFFQENREYWLLPIAALLNVNTTFTSLEIAQHQIGNNGAISITKALKVNSSLILLNLSYNQIGNKGALSITDA